MDTFQIISQAFQEQEISSNSFKVMKESSKAFKILEENFYSISPNTLFFDVNLKDEILDRIRTKFNSLKNEIENFNTNDRWNEIEIDNMFGKGFNPTSLVTSAESAQWFTSNLNLPNDKDFFSVAELGCGAGWSTTMLYNSLKSVSQEQSFYIHSIDMSPHAIAATQALLEYYGIKYILVRGSQFRSDLLDLISQGKIPNCIILELGDFTNVLSNYPDNYFGGFYSTHGTAYLSEQEYRQFLDTIFRKGVGDSPFVADSLNPLYTNRLSTPITLLQMLFPNVLKKFFDARKVKYVFAKKTLPNTSKYYTDEEVKVIKIFNEERADLILRWSNFLIRNLYWGRLLKTKKSLDVTMDVVERYRSDVYPSSKIPTIIDSAKFGLLNGAPEFTIFLETIGLKIEK